MRPHAQSGEETGPAQPLTMQRERVERNVDIADTRVEIEIEMKEGGSTEVKKCRPAQHGPENRKKPTRFVSNFRSGGPTRAKKPKQESPMRIERSQRRKRNRKSDSQRGFSMFNVHNDGASMQHRHRVCARVPSRDSPRD